jgi:PTH1 family peptidyl-tRNA hydrolase
LLLVAGLGNPGREYARNRHNAGYLVVDELVKRHAGSWRSKFSGQVAEIRHGDARLVLLKPETYMNESGRSVGGAAAFFKVEPRDVLVVHDEGDFDLGRLELKLGGGLAGHNGLRSIAQHLRTQDFLRLRIGVGRPERGDPRDLADYVLSDFEPHDDAEAIVVRAANAVELLADEGLERARAEVNRR